MASSCVGGVGSATRAQVKGIRASSCPPYTYSSWLRLHSRASGRSALMRKETWSLLTVAYVDLVEHEQSCPLVLRLGPSE